MRPRSVGATWPVVLDFYAAGSTPCAALAPRYAAVAEKIAGKVRFLKVQHQRDAGLATRLGSPRRPRWSSSRMAWNSGATHR